MNSYQSKPFKRPEVENNFRSAYNRSFEYRNVDLPLSHVQVKREVRKDLTTPFFQEKNLSTYNLTFGIENRDLIKNSDYYPRSSMNTRFNLRRLHEEYMENSPKPNDFFSTTTGTTHNVLKPISTPKTLSSNNPGKEYTCPIQLFGKDQFPFIPLNEISYYKLLDNYVSTTHLTHSNFSENQKNGIAKKDVITYYDAVGTSKCRGRQILTHFGPYFDKVDKSLNKLFPKKMSRVPNSGAITTYNKDYKQISTNLNNFEYNIEFPVQYKLTQGDIFTVPGMYCTEKHHLGTGWSTKAIM